MAEATNGEKDETNIKRTKHRSPNYPSIGLRKAVEMVRSMEGKYRRSVVPIHLLHSLLGYKEHSGAGNQAVAALKSFGLITVTGEGKERQIQLHEDGQHIARNGPSSDLLLKAAALKPPIYSELWEKYRDEGMPDDDLIKHYLEWERKEGTFNKDVIAGFIADFKDTLAFAKLSSDDIIKPADDVAEDNNEDQDGQAPGERDPRTVAVPLRAGRGAQHPPTAQQRRPAMPAGTKEATLPLDTGTLYLAWPEDISQSEIEDVENWMQMMIRKMKRSAEGVKYTPHKSQLGDTDSRSNDDY